MKTTQDLIELLKEYDERIDKAMKDYAGRKEDNPEENRKFNALMYHLEDAYESLKAGLNGEF